MDISLLLFGILPLLIFVIIDSISGVKAGVIAAVLFAIGEIIYTLIVYKTIDNLTIGSSLLVLIFGLLSFKYNKPIYMKLQPVVVGFIFSVILLVMQFLGKPLMVLMAQKYQYMLPEQYRSMMLHPVYLTMLARLSAVLGVGFFVHAGLVLYAAFFMNKWWWIIFRGIGFYLMLIVCMLIVRFF